MPATTASSTATLAGRSKIPGLRDDLFGYRLNLVYQGGDTAIENQSVTRNLASAAFDIHLWDGTLLQLNGAHSFYYVNGITPTFNSSLSPFPAPANPATIGSPSWVRFNDETDNGGFKFTWKLYIFSHSAWLTTTLTKQDKPK